ncbi:hypothetical protein ACTXGQ_18210, partial [Marinobacter sp. 1Y8]
MFGNDQVHNRVHPDEDKDFCPDATDLFIDDPSECFDNDMDGVGDNADDDDDNDGVLDDYELAYGLDPLTDDTAGDLDGDGYPNGYEYEQGLDPSENEFDDRIPELVASYPGVSGVDRVLLHPSGDYVMTAGGSQVQVFQRDATTGELTPLATTSLEGLYIANGQFSPDGDDVYFFGNTSQYGSSIARQVSHYRFLSSGELEFVETIALQSWVEAAEQVAGQPYEGGFNSDTGFAISSSGEHLYLGLYRTGILIFDRDVESGSLTFREHFRNGGETFNARNGLVLSADGDTLYAQGSDDQWMLARDQVSGALSVRHHIEYPSNTNLEGVTSGLLPDSALYVTPSVSNYYSWNDVVAIDGAGSEVRFELEIDVGLLVGDASQGQFYTYKTGVLATYALVAGEPELLGEVAREDVPEVNSLDDLVVSPDGKYLYAVSTYQQGVIALSAGYKGMGRPDADGDGVEDYFDVFPSNPAESTDTDQDGIGNNADSDDDGDGYSDAVDDFPLDKQEWLDTDEDGVGNNADNDDDGDGHPDSEDVFPFDSSEWADVDGDGVGDIADQDDDNDGMADSWELENGLDPLNAADAILNGDGDELTNVQEFENDSDPTIADTDGDGYLDHDDQMPRDSEENKDSDQDGLGDTADLDDDGDGLSDICEVRYGFDPLDPAPAEQDTDGDTAIDALECQAGTDPTLADTDSDGMRDDYELAYGLDPLTDDTAGDLDGDGYSNGYEYEQGLDPSENEFDDRVPELVASYAAVSGVDRVLLHPSGDYVMAIAGIQVQVFQRDTTTGKLTPLATTMLDGLYIANGQFSPEGNDVYFFGKPSKYGSSIARQVRHYRFLPSGELEFVETIALQSWVEAAEQVAGQPYEGGFNSSTGFAISPSGEHLYLGLYRTGILIFDRDVESGALTFREHFRNGGETFNARNGLVLSADGGSLYAQGPDDQWVLARDQVSGALSVRHQIEHPSNTNLEGVTSGLSPDSALYVTPSRSTNFYSWNDVVAIDGAGSEVRFELEIDVGLLV